MDVGEPHPLLTGDRWKEENQLVFPSLVGTPTEARNLYRGFKIDTGKRGLAGYPLSRPAAHCRHAHAQTGRAPQSRTGAAWARGRYLDPEHLFARLANPAKRRC